MDAVCAENRKVWCLHRWLDVVKAAVASTESAAPVLAFIPKIKASAP